MQTFQTGLARRPRAVGLKLAVIGLVLLVVVGAWVGAYYGLKRSGQSGPVDRLIEKSVDVWPSWMPGGKVKKAVYTEPEPNGLAIDPRDEELRRQRREMEALRREIDAMKNQKPATAAPAKTSPEPKKRARAKAVYVVNEVKPPANPGMPLYTLPAWEYLPCVLENIVSSEVPGMFTVKLTRPVMDATRQHVLIPQGQRVGAEAASAHLLVGNERIPTFALSVSLPNGQALDLGHAPIMDAAGTNGLTGEVNNHWWRLVWSSIFIEGIRAGQQILTQEISSQGDGVTISGVGQYSSNLAQQRLGRGQDTRPTITVSSGETCNILVPKPLSLPAYASQ